MKYEIGQKVETPFGIAEIVFLHDIPIKWARVKIPNNHEWLYSFNVDDLKPYKTPYEKLLEMGFEFEEVLDWGENPFCHNWRKDDQRITIYLSENTITTYEVCKEAIAVLTQYLEWLEEEK